MKKALSVLLLVLLLITPQTINFAGASASDILGDYKYGDFRYNITDENTITLKKYEGNLENVEIPSEIKDMPVTEIDSTFSGNSDIKLVTIPDGVKIIGLTAFSNCKSLAEINIPDSVESIESAAFKNCSLLTKVTLPDSVAEISSGAFSGCQNLESIYIGSGLKQINIDALNGLFAGDSKLQKIEVSPDNKAFTTDGNVLMSKDKTKIVYFPMSTTGEYTVPDSVKEIGFRAFSQAGIDSIVLPENLETVGEYAFSGSKITSLQIPESVKNIGSFAFANLQIESLKIPSAFKSNGIGVFSNCKKLKSVEIEEGITSINESTFENSSLLEDVKLPQSLKLIGAFAFKNCKSLSTVTFPEKSETVGERAFEGCSALTEINLPYGLKELYPMAFNGCTNLKTVVLPKTIDYIGPKAFDATAWYENQPDGVIYVDDWAVGYKGDIGKADTVNIKNGTVHISGLYSYSNASRTGVCYNIPNSVKRIDSKAIGYRYISYELNKTPVSSLKISGVKGSAAEKYATENGFEFEDRDAVLSDLDVDYIPSVVGSTSTDVKDGDSVKLYTTIRNNSIDSFGGSLKVSFIVDGKVVDTVICDKAVDTGKSITVTCDKTWNAWFGSHTVKVLVEPIEKTEKVASETKQAVSYDASAVSDDGSNINILKQRLVVAETN